MSEISIEFLRNFGTGNGNSTKLGNEYYKISLLIIQQLELTFGSNGSTTRVVLNPFVRGLAPSISCTKYEFGLLGYLL